MKSTISNSLLAAIKPSAKPIEIRDSRLKGFVLRVQPSGVMTYYIEFSRGRRMSLGRTDGITPVMAREKAKELLAEAYQGNDPIAAKKRGKRHTLKSFLDEVYKEWAEANLRTGHMAIARLKFAFPDFLDRSLSDITILHIEKWRASRVKAGNKPSTINRVLDDLRSALNHAVDWEMLESNPAARVKRSRVDPSPNVRFLSEDENLRLRKALLVREERNRTHRYNANLWREVRGYELMKDLKDVVYTDRLQPMVLISLNTGVRQGELFSLKWDDIDLERANLTVHGTTSKSGRTRHIPLNAEAVSALRKWKECSPTLESLVFPGKDGRLNNTRTSWLAVLKDAEIQSFRWHDMRHDFASQLVMVGVDLNTVRELLGHSDYKMTLRYAHLAPQHKAAAVAKLVRIA